MSAIAVDGALREVLSLPDSTGPELVSRIKIMADMDIVERRRPQDGQFETTIDGSGVDVRVATGATIWGETAVLRLLDKSRSMKHLSELGMPDGHLPSLPVDRSQAVRDDPVQRPDRLRQDHHALRNAGGDQPQRART